MREHTPQTTVPVARPKTSPSKIPTTKTKSEDARAPKDEQTELFEYEWPDLPPIPRMKDAITRKRVSRGISYLLPVDKSRASIDCKYRTDLRAMFQEPYVHDNLEYDDGKILLSSKVHFLSNTANNKWTKKHVNDIPVRINSESDHARRLYSRSAPAGGSASRHVGLDSNKLKKRSNLFLPIKAEIPEEAIKIREAAQKIIKSFHDNDEEYNSEKDTSIVDGTKNENKTENNLKRTEDGTGREIEQKLFHRVKTHRPTAQHFNSYHQLKQTKPPKPKIPNQIQSRFLTYNKNQEIWEWLHFGETISPFEYFLSVCG